jgi:DNA helicase-2/ATP-dependent DNA helicase PcrA
VGERSLDKVAEAAEAAGMSAFAFLAHPNFPELYKANRKMLDFAEWCSRLAKIDTTRADVAVKEILALSGLVESAIAAADKDDLSEDRIENLHAMIGRAGEFVSMRLAASPDAVAGADPDSDEEEIRAATAIDLAAFLEDVALVADIDSYEGVAEKITLMTLHSAKGLEFDNVFVTGLEEGLLPHRNCRDDAALEEERRLFYVGITRAKKRAWITHATTRFIHGSVDFTKPSQFLAELPESSVTEQDFGDRLSTQFGGGYKSGGGTKKGAWEDLDDPFTDDEFADVDVPDAFPDFDADPVFADEDGFIPPAKKAWPKPPPKVRPARSSKFRPGDLVRHPLFGSGKVLTADKGKIMVQFFASGTRLLNEDLAQLSKE